MNNNPALSCLRINTVCNVWILTTLVLFLQSDWRLTLAPACMTWKPWADLSRAAEQQPCTWVIARELCHVLESIFRSPKWHFSNDWAAPLTNHSCCGRNEWINCQRIFALLESTCPVKHNGENMDTFTQKCSSRLWYTNTWTITCWVAPLI